MKRILTDRDVNVQATGHMLHAETALHRKPKLPRAPWAILNALLSIVGLLTLILRELRRIRKILDTRLPGATTSIGLKSTTVPKEG